MTKYSKHEISAEPFMVLQSEKEKLQSVVLEQQKEIEELKSRLDNMTDSSIEMEESKKELEKQRQFAIESMKKNIALEEHLLSTIENEERLLLSYKKLIRQYEALSTSRLGKLTLFYWQKRRKLFGGK